MKKDEISRIYVSHEYGYGEMGCPPRIPKSAAIVYTVEVTNFFDGRNTIEFEDMTAEERKTAPFQKVVDFYHSEQKMANNLFNEGKFKPAIARYRRMMNQMQDVSVQDEEEDDRRKGYLLKLYLNISQCYLNLQNAEKALIYADLALKEDPENIKGLYRMGKACTLLNEYERAKEYLLRAKAQKPYDRAVNEALKQLDKRQKQHLVWEKDFSKRSLRNWEEAEKSVEKNEFTEEVEKRVVAFLAADIKELHFSPGCTEGELEAIQGVAKKHDLAYVSKIQSGNKIIKLAKKKRFES